MKLKVNGKEEKLSGNQKIMMRQISNNDPTSFQDSIASPFTNEMMGVSTQSKDFQIQNDESRRQQSQMGLGVNGPGFDQSSTKVKPKFISHTKK